MEKVKATKAETGEGKPTSSEPVKAPMIGVIQTNVAGKGVEATPAQPANVPEKAYDMPPDPCEIRCHPQLGLITCQMMKFNYDHQVKAGAQEPYDPESLLIHWNTLTVYGQNPNESPATQAPAVGAVGGAGGGGGNPPHYPVAAGLGYISPVDYVSPNYQNLMHYKPGGPGGTPPGAPGGGGGGGGGGGETQHLQKLLQAPELILLMNYRLYALVRCTVLTKERKLNHSP